MSNAIDELFVPNTGNIVFCNDSPFDKASNAVLYNQDGSVRCDGLIYSFELMDSRIFDAKTKGDWRNSSVCKYGSYTAEEPLYNPKSSDKRILLRPPSKDLSLVLKNATLAVDAHSSNNEFYPPNFDVSEHLAKLGKNNYYVLNKDDIRKGGIPVGRFKEFGILNFSAGNDLVRLQLYEELCDKAGIKQLYVWMNNDDNYIDSKSSPFANQLWLHRLDGYSDVDGDIRNLYCNSGVRGVRRVSSAGGSAQNITSVPSAASEIYSPIENEDWNRIKPYIKDWDRSAVRDIVSQWYKKK